MSEKHETIRQDPLLYFLVDFEPAGPRVFVVPSAMVAEAVHTEPPICV